METTASPCVTVSGTKNAAMRCRQRQNCAMVTHEWHDRKILWLGMILLLCQPTTAGTTSMEGNPQQCITEELIRKMTNKKHHIDVMTQLILDFVGGPVLTVTGCPVPTGYGPAVNGDYSEASEILNALPDLPRWKQEKITGLLSSKPSLYVRTGDPNSTMMVLCYITTHVFGEERRCWGFLQYRKLGSLLVPYKYVACLHAPFNGRERSRARSPNAETDAKALGTLPVGLQWNRASYQSGTSRNHARWVTSLVDIKIANKCCVDDEPDPEDKKCCYDWFWKFFCCFKAKESE
jgi:hypothetical protein